MDSEESSEKKDDGDDESKRIELESIIQPSENKLFPKQRNIFDLINNRQYFHNNNINNDYNNNGIRGNIQFVSRMERKGMELKGHSGCVNTIQWNASGSFLLTGADDCRINIYNGNCCSCCSLGAPSDPPPPPPPSSLGSPFGCERHSLLYSFSPGHFRNIFCASFVPFSSDNKIASCGMDGEVRLTDISEARGSSPQNVSSTSSSGATLRNNCDSICLSSYENMVYKLFFLPQTPQAFVTTHQDGCVRLFDLRCKIPSPNQNILLKLRASPTLFKGHEGDDDDDDGGGEDDQKKRRSRRRRHRKGRVLSIHGLAFSPSGERFIIGGADPILRMYDIRKLNDSNPKNPHKHNPPPVLSVCPKEVLDAHKQRREHHDSSFITGVHWSRNSSLGEILATYSREDVFMFHIDSPDYSPNKDPIFPVNDNVDSLSMTGPSSDDIVTNFAAVYRGRRNVSTFLKEVSLFHDSYVVTGSDCGHAFIWEKNSGRLLRLLKADDTVVNGIAPHPSLPLLATCGIDPTGKVFHQTELRKNLDREYAGKIVDRNKTGGGGFGGSFGEEAGLSLIQLWDLLSRMRRRQQGGESGSDRGPGIIFRQHHGSDSSSDSDSDPSESLSGSEFDSSSSHEAASTETRPETQTDKEKGEMEKEGSEGRSSQKRGHGEEGGRRQRRRRRRRGISPLAFTWFLRGDEDDEPDDTGDASAPGGSVEEPSMDLDEEGDEIKEIEKMVTSILQEASGMRLKANDLFREMNYNEASSAYSQALKFLDSNLLDNSVDRRVSPDLSCEIRDSRILCVLNRGACHLKTGRLEECIEDCTWVIEVDGGNVKARFRRGSAYFRLGMLEKALNDLEIAHSLYPEDESIEIMRNDVLQQFNSKTEEMKD